MLKEDYIMRLLQHFSESLAKWLSGKKSESPEWLTSFNNEVVKPYLDKEIGFFEEKRSDELVEYFTASYADKQERISRLEILSDALYQRALLEKNSNIQKNLFGVTLEMLQYINFLARTYSPDREQRISELQNR